MSTTAEQVPATTTPVSDQQVRLYRYSTWVHVGPDAENCPEVNEESGENACANPLHFHAWCRLPNQFQARDIRELAFAAKARRIRQLRNEGTDAYEVLEEEMDALLRGGDLSRPAMLDELVNHQWWADYLEAAAAAREFEDEKGDTPYERVAEDQRRYQELAAGPEESRGDEYVELESHLAAYAKVLEEKVAEVVEPKRVALDSRSTPELVDMVREQRIEGAGGDAFTDAYAMNEWLLGTLRTPGGDKVFSSAEHLRGTAPEVIEALKATFEDLETTERGEAGNS